MIIPIPTSAASLFLYTKAMCSTTEDRIRLKNGILPLHRLSNSLVTLIVNQDTTNLPMNYAKNSTT